MSASTRRPPPPRASLRTTLALRGDPLAAFQRSIAETGEVVRFLLGHRTFVLLTHPDDVRHVLQDAAGRYSKDTRTYRTLSALIGDGLLTSNGERWTRQRRACQPAFHRARVARLDEVVTAAAGDLISSWRAAAAEGRPVDAGREMARFTLAVVVRAFLGSCTAEEASRLGAAVEVAVGHLSRRIEALGAPPAWWPARSNRELAAARRQLDDAVSALLVEAECGTAAAGSLIPRLLEAALVERCPRNRVADQVKTLLTAGYETTANALTWTLYLLAVHPDVARRVESEVDHLGAADAPTYGDLASLRVTRAVFLEALRLYPPAWLFERRAIADDVIRGFAIPAGTTLAVCPYLTHRREDYWHDPERFDPGRFMVEARAGFGFAYYPFGGAARHCIGDHFAMMEALLALASIVRAFRFELARPGEVRPRAGVTLRPAVPVTLNLTERCLR